jgi:hypothetical protein
LSVAIVSWIEAELAAAWAGVVAANVAASVAPSAASMVVGCMVRPLGRVVITHHDPDRTQFLPARRGSMG